MKSGILLIDKPCGDSSAKVIAKVKKKLSLKKIGHAGTLDPLATGLLICLVGSATRVAKYASHGAKAYTGTIRLGIETDTEDISGDVVASSEYRPSDEEIEIVRRKYLGNIMQIPPRVSAIKIDGERAYLRALRGEDFSISPRDVEILEMSLNRLDNDILRFQIKCSPGTYIRAIARDIGRDLNCGACIESLRRTESFPFSVEGAKSIESVREEDILDIRVLFPKAPVYLVESDEARLLRNGDVRFVESIGNRFSSSSLETSVLPQELICLEKSSGISLGLLVQERGRWEIGIIL